MNFRLIGGLLVWALAAHGAEVVRPPAPNVIRPLIFSLPAPIQSLHPFALDAGNFLTIVDLVVEKLADADEFGTLAPRLAQSWHISKDRRTFTFRLRENVKFSDGQPLTAADVKFSYEMIFDDRFKGAGWREMFAGVRRVETPGPREVRFITEKVDSELFRVLATQLRIYPAHFFTATPPAAWNASVIGSGPYVLKHFEPGGKALLSKNADWWGMSEKAFAKRFTFPQIQFRVLADPWTAATMIGKGEIDLFQLRSPAELEKIDAVLVRDAGKVKLVRSEARKFARTLGIEFNLRRAILSTPRVREALNLMLNRDLISQKVFHGHLRPSASYFGRQSPYFRARAATPFDPPKALALLKLEGWKENSAQGVLEKADGTQLRLQILYEDHELEPFLSLLKEDAAKIGVVFSLQKTEGSNTWKVLNEHKFDLYASIGSDWSTILPSVIHTGGAFNYTGFSDSQIDAWLDQLPEIFEGKAHRRVEQKIAARIDSLWLKILGFESSEGFYLVSERIEIPKDTASKGPFYWRLKNN